MSRATEGTNATGRIRHALVAALLLFVPVPLHAQPSGPARTQEELKARVEQLRTEGALRIGEALVLSRALTLAVYEGRDYLPLWTSEVATASLLRAVEGVLDDGLDPESYHFSALHAAGNERTDPAVAAELDLLATDALVRMGHDLRYGKAQPEWPVGQNGDGWPAGEPEAVAELVEFVSSGSVREALVALRPRHFVYTGLMSDLSDLRWVQGMGGWEPIRSGPAVQRDGVDERVPLLRARLALEGDLTGTTNPTSLRYDAAIEAAVRSFQHRHGLNEDGIVESATLAALNVPVEKRIDQVRINLERARWVAHALPHTFVAVNVAGAEVHLIREDDVEFETRAIVGALDTPTPTFAADIRYVVLNPTWTVPRGVVGEILELVRADPDYLRSQGMRLFDPSGLEVDPADIDFAAYTAADFPYRIRQDPGPANALGQVKLMLPNEHQVYLHDTPSRALFNQERRLFSHGCIRIEDPLGFAEMVLDDPVSWNRETLRAAIATGVTRTIPLPRPVPVFVVYWTAAVDPGGKPHYYPDVYGRDAAVLAALDAAPAPETQDNDRR